VQALISGLHHADPPHPMIDAIDHGQMPVLPKDPNLLPSLTFSSILLILKPWFSALDDPLQEVSDASTYRLCPRRLRRGSDKQVMLYLSLLL
jgi:hypothetical protein